MWKYVHCERKLLSRDLYTQLSQFVFCELDVLNLIKNLILLMTDLSLNLNSFKNIQFFLYCVFWYIFFDEQFLNKNRINVQLAVQ